MNTYADLYKAHKVKLVDLEQKELHHQKAMGKVMEESAIGRSDASRPSMAQDIDKKRRTEIHAINGFVVEKGAEIGLTAPANAALVEAVTQVETGKSKQSLDLVRSI